MVRECARRSRVESLCKGELVLPQVTRVKNGHQAWVRESARDVVKVASVPPSTRSLPRPRLKGVHSSTAVHNETTLKTPISKPIGGFASSLCAEHGMFDGSCQSFRRVNMWKCSSDHASGRCPRSRTNYSLGSTYSDVRAFLK